MPVKTTVITGGTSGIGKETVLALAQKDHAIYMLVRDVEKGKAVRDELILATGNKNIYVIYCDLANLQTVKDAANALKEKLFAVNVLINNAGGIVNNLKESNDGFELTFAMNHLGHFLLTLSLMPLLERGQARIINLSSEAHKMGKPDFDSLKAADFATKRYSAMQAYGNAKLFNIYFAQTLAERYHQSGITAFAVHPGIVNTNFGSGLKGLGNLLLFLARPFMVNAQKGAQTSVYLATTAKVDAFNGKYLKNSKVAKLSGNTNNQAARNHLWELSLACIQHFL